MTESKKSLDEKLKINAQYGISQKRSIEMNADGAEFWSDTGRLVEGSTWDYPGSPYSDEVENEDD